MQAGHDSMTASSTTAAHSMSMTISFEVLCLAIAIPFALFVVEPSFRRLRARGYNPWHVMGPAAGLFLASVVMGWFFQWAFAPALATPVVYLLAVAILPARSSSGHGSPLPAARMPTGESNRRFEARTGVAGVGGTSPLGWISGFLSPVDAEVARIRLESEGVPALVDGNVLAHVDPPVQWSGGGITLLVEEKNLDAAMAALRDPGPEEELSGDLETPQPVEEKVENDGVALSIFLFFILMIVLPMVILALRHASPTDEFEVHAAFRDAFILTVVILILVFKRLRTTNREHQESAP